MIPQYKKTKTVSSGDVNEGEFSHPRSKEKNKIMNTTDLKIV